MNCPQGRAERDTVSRAPTRHPDPRAPEPEYVAAHQDGETRRGNHTSHGQETEYVKQSLILIQGR